MVRKGKHWCSEEILNKMCEKHWPEYYWIGSRPNDKGAHLHRKSDDEEVQRQDSNDIAYLLMLRHITGEKEWNPEPKKIKQGLELDVAEKSASNIFNKILNAKESRVKSDRLFKLVGVEPFDPSWERKLNNLMRAHK
jgi:hypothetical protein